jgi:signal transduction histidine kinase
MPVSLRVRTIPPRLLLGLLIGLLALLGTLQYRWSGELSQAEGVRMRAGAQERAESFARDFDREITRAFLRLGHPGAPGAADPLADYAAQVDRWRSSTAYPGLVGDVWLVESDGRLMRLRGRTFVPADWPADWGALRERFTPPAGIVQVFDSRPGTPLGRAGWTAGPLLARAQVAGAPMAGGSALRVGSVTSGAAAGGFAGAFRDDRMAAGPFAFLPDGAPAFVLPVLRTMPTVSGPRFTRIAPLASLVVVVDLAYVRDHVLPALAERHFGGPDGLEYVLAIGRSDDPAAPVWRSAAAPGRGAPDASAGLLELRPEDADEGDLREMMRPRDAVWVGPGGPDGRTAPPTFSFATRLDNARERNVRVVKRGRWQLQATHRDGSLDAVVTAARRRNLAVGFGILILLGASAVLLVQSARRAERLARRQIEFVAGVTHELRTPLAVIRSAGENLADGVVDAPADVRRYGELVRDEGRRLTTMVEETLELAGAESGRLAPTREPVAVGALLHDTLREWSTHAAGRYVRADADVAVDLPPVLGDEAALKRALGNLLDNAAKYGGDAPWVGVRASVRGPTVEVTVEDHGPGIPPDEREQVFEPFYRGRDARARRIRGSGLGLSLVRGIVESHGGNVRIGDSSAGGAALTVTLPALRGGAE